MAIILLVYFLLVPEFVKFVTPLREKMETISVPEQSNKNSRCLLISKGVFYRNIPNSDFDTFLSKTQSILFDFYKLYNNDFERVYNAKSRHVMALQILTKRLNLSINSCGADQYPSDEDKLDINFAVMPYDLQLNGLGKIELIHSRDEYIIKFASVKIPDVSLMFLSLVKPIGISLFLASCFLLLILALDIWLLSKISERNCAHKGGGTGTGLSIFVLIPVLTQALLGQCVSYRRTVELFRNSTALRLAYLSWLFYCILISSGYNGNLLQQLMEPGATVQPETFKDLLADTRNLVGFAEARLGQVPDILKCLGREATERPEIFEKLLQKFDSRTGVSYPEHIIDGTVNVMADEAVLRALLDTLEKRYGISHYGMSTERIIHPIFWAVSRTTRRKNEILQTLKVLASSGITDYHSWQQEVTETLVAQKVLQAFFGGLFSTDVEEEDKDESLVEVKARLYLATQNRIKSLGLEIPKGAEPIKLKHYLVMWIILCIGFNLAAIVFIGERFAKNGSKIYGRHFKTQVEDFTMPI